MPVRTEEMTSVMARTEAAAGRTSSSRPSWVEVDGAVDGVGRQRGELVLGADPALGPGAGLRGGEHGERSVTERGERLGLGEDLGDDRDLVALVAVVLGRGGDRGDLRGVGGRQVGGGGDLAQAEAAQRRQQASTRGASSAYWPG